MEHVAGGSTVLTDTRKTEYNIPESHAVVGLRTYSKFKSQQIESLGSVRQESFRLISYVGVVVAALDCGCPYGLRDFQVTQESDLKPQLDLNWVFEGNYPPQHFLLEWIDESNQSQELIAE